MQDDLRAALVGTRFAAHIHRFATLDSTNTRLLAAAAEGAAEGTVYLADEQTAGRGRGGHAWHSAAGVFEGEAEHPAGLYVSVLVKPALRLREALWISLATGLAAQAAVLAATAITVELRWPNDLLLGHRKLGGILVETSAGSGDDAPLHYAVIGIGINLNQQEFPPELAEVATSLRLATGHPQPRQPLLVALLRSFDRELTLLEDATHASTPFMPAPSSAMGSGGNSLLQRFAEASGWACGRRVSVPEQGGYTGTTAGLDSRGFLLVDADDGTQRTVLSGGVRDLT